MGMLEPAAAAHRRLPCSRPDLAECCSLLRSACYSDMTILYLRKESGFFVSKKTRVRLNINFLNQNKEEIIISGGQANWKEFVYFLFFC